MQYLFKPSYVRSVKNLDKVRAEQVYSAFEQLVHLFKTGEKTPGLGLKHLRNDVWEIRAGLTDRIIFRKKQDTIELVIAGTHDEIKRLLKTL